MSQPASKRRAWIWVAVALGVLLLLGLCSFVAVFAALTQGGDAFAGGGSIALIRVEGTLTEGEDAGDLFGGGAFSRTIISQLRRAKNDPVVQAIVMRVNSPGGGIVASDDIYREVLRIIHAGKPIVVSMGTVAASGGYYISAPASRIVASPGTMTGSIGVMATVPNAKEAFDKLGISVTVIKSGPHKDASSLFREMTEEEVAHYQSMIDQMYEQFVSIVAEGRQMDKDRVRQIGDGSVYTGEQAKQLGLVDELGDLETAVDLAAELGGITGKPRIVEYRRPSFFETVFGSSTAGPPKISLDGALGPLGAERRVSLQYLYVE